ncbi:MAG: tetratricopeptide repeat protein [Halobacteriota archaeon]
MIALYREWIERSVELKLKLMEIEAEIETKAGTGLGIPKPDEIPPFVIDELRKDTKTINQRLEKLGIPAGAIKEVKLREDIPESLKHEIELIQAKIELTGDFYGLEKPVSYFISLGNFYFESKNYEKAIEQYGKVLEKEPENDNALFNRGRAYNEKGDYDKALEDYNLYLEKIDPNGAAAYNNRGNAYSGLKQYERAIEDYSKAIELNLKYADAYYNRGLAYRKLKQYERAIEDYNKAIDLNPKHALAYNNRGLAYGELKQYERAIEDYNKAIDLNPKYAYAYNNRGLTYRKLKQYVKEQEDYKKALELDSKDILALLNFSESYILTKNYVGAHATAEKALNIAEESKDIIISHFLMVCSSLFQNKNEDARSQLNRLIEYPEKIKDWTLEWDFSDIAPAIESSDLDGDPKSLMLSLIELLENKITVGEFKNLQKLD